MRSSAHKDTGVAILHFATLRYVTSLYQSLRSAEPLENQLESMIMKSLTNWSFQEMLAVETLLPPLNNDRAYAWSG